MGAERRNRSVQTYKRFQITCIQSYQGTTALLARILGAKYTPRPLPQTSGKGQETMSSWWASSAPPLWSEVLQFPSVRAGLGTLRPLKQEQSRPTGPALSADCSGLCRALMCVLQRARNRGAAHPWLGHRGSLVHGMQAAIHTGKLLVRLGPSEATGQSAPWIAKAGLAHIYRICANWYLVQKCFGVWKSCFFF